ncbi:acyl-CoA thioesterase [Mycobacterium avium]|uniref:acyl-CoA thioesterase n=1 Tax=Mycobacterium avium TaxID=1764 RepID=UPI0003D1C939|nr:thioesterase family protein [Mycobacterium avium]ETB09841.1 acyl-CoA thioesterase [Mycobacterium avium subsp. silvaticum ATCC 49884]ETB21090.1 acyl-CoA thioesterase [Mycobacterium avium subsp. avium 11-4751]ANR93504.1 acyl-CoA thioesterase [Mycobacterium avium]MBZ4537497.1 thioesterase family protein [Mycobacterium avium subsp. hominissuis]MBZ4580569.1 thioesterase family protein [Mycobacterium avium subsp. hominissuis]
MTDTHVFDEALRLDTLGADARRGRTHPEWANMVGPFGGITAATLLSAVHAHPDRIGDPLALTVNYAAPIADGDFDVTLRAARTNRTNQHWIVELSQDDVVKTTATAIFALRRDSWSDTEARPPGTPPPERLPSVDPGLVRWTGRYDMRYVEGAMPGRGEDPSPSSTSTLWVRDKAGRPVDYPALAALCDIFYPRVFLRRGGFVPSGTISLTTYFHADQHELDAVGDDFVLASAHANRFDRGYFDQSARVWTRQGGLLASSHQVVYFKG